MKKCPKCQKILSISDARFCEYCGFELMPSTPAKPVSEVDDDLDFVITEAHDEGPEFVGGLNGKKSDQDDLGLQSTADLMEQEANGESHHTNFSPSGTNDVDLIGDSEPPLPPGSAYNYNDPEPPPPPVQKPQTLMANPAYNPDPQAALTPEPVEPVSENDFPASSPESLRSYLSDAEKQELINKIEKEDQPFDNQPIVPPKKKKDISAPPLELDPDIPKPAMAKRTRGIAFFYKNYIQIKGDQHLHENDEMEIGDRAYLLREKKISPKVLIAIAAPLFTIILFIIGAQFIRDTGNGLGRVVGMTFDENQQPYLHEAEIRFPELDKSFYSNPQGFFITSTLPSGTHKVEYYINGDLVGVDYTTVFDNEITMLMLEPKDAELADANVSSEPAGSASQPSAKSKPVETETQTTSTSSTTAAVSRQNNESKNSSPKKTSDPYAKLTLAANVDDARLKLNNSVLGAGNLTFSKIKPGNYTWVVTKDGYESLSGNIDLKAGETSKLKVTLKPLTTAQKQEAYDEKDFYYSGQSAYKNGDYQTALTDFTKAVELKNSYADAYYQRAETYLKLKNLEKAHDDYLRAAEIYQIRKDINQAITAYNKAIETNNKSIPAYLGRGNLYLNKGEEIAAIADFETVHDLDKKNVQAYYGLGEARFKQGYYKKAVDHFKDARSLDKDNPKVYQYLMLSYLGANDIKNVKKSYEKFRDVANEEQLNQMNTDKQYSAVMRVINADN
ncbi:MAG: tetratricopeptide repeat protein [Candidatus Zixiibacteriota bacterium]